MKKELALLLGVAMLGVATAADVTTANTAVVIRKTPVESADGFQFLCVPVRGFDITGQGTGVGVPLDDILPPAELPDGAELTVEANSTGVALDAEGTADLLADGTYKIADGKWTSNSTQYGTELLKCGARLWLKVKTTTATNALDALLAAMGGATVTATAEEPTPETIFCGEQNVVEGALVPDDVSPGMTAFGNTTDKVVDVTEVCANPQNYDEILRISDGGKEYQYLEYWDRAGVKAWVYYGPTGITELPVDKAEWIRAIAPGEAFYYYRRAAQ